MAKTPGIHAIPFRAWRWPIPNTAAGVTGAEVFEGRPRSYFPHPQMEQGARLRLIKDLWAFDGTASRCGFSMNGMTMPENGSLLRQTTVGVRRRRPDAPARGLYQRFAIAEQDRRFHCQHPARAGDAPGWGRAVLRERIGIWCSPDAAQRAAFAAWCAADRGPSYQRRWSGSAMHR